MLIFTSGTAGSPKAAMLTHGNLLANLEQCQAHPGRQQGPDDVVFGVLPLFHIFGLNVVLGLQLRGGRHGAAHRAVRPAVGASSRCVDHGVTVISGAPTMWAAWAALPGAPADAFATVRLATSGAAKLDPEVRQAIQRALRPRPQRGLRAHRGVAGRHVRHRAARRPRAASACRCPASRCGSSTPTATTPSSATPARSGCKGPNVFAGYWEDPEATADALTPDGWLRTGDVAVVDDDGFLFLVDRVKDLIIVSGFNVYPAEVEEVLASHPAVAHAAVVGVPHPHSGEAVKAYVVTAEGVSVEEDELIDHCEAHLARYKCPQKVMFVDEIPQSATGKVLRKELRAAG